MSFGGNIRTQPLTSLLLAGSLSCAAPASEALGFFGPACNNNGVCEQGEDGNNSGQKLTTLDSPILACDRKQGCFSAVGFKIGGSV